MQPQPPLPAHATTSSKPCIGDDSNKKKAKAKAPKTAKPKAKVTKAMKTKVVKAKVDKASKKISMKAMKATKDKRSTNKKPNNTAKVKVPKRKPAAVPPVADLGSEAESEVSPWTCEDLDIYAQWKMMQLVNVRAGLPVPEFRTFMKNAKHRGYEN